MRLEKESKIKLGLIGLILILVMVTINPSLRLKVKQPFYSVLKPVYLKFRTANSFLGSWGRVISNLNSLRSEMERREKERLRLLTRISEMEQTEVENEELRKALEMELQEEFQMTLVRVIGNRQDQHQVVLSKGRRDGIEKGMPVINSQKVVGGEVVQVSKGISKVRLASHPQTSFSAQLKDEKIEGEIKGDGSGLKLDFIPQDEKVEKGQVVVTSALGGDFPAGLLIGEVEQIKQKDVAPFQIATVKPYFEFNKFLFVITAY